ncbi:Two-component sensor histidine kinase [Candidatus Desulfarcum epimagneticum]|uniref:histidine kinase n=1 Tax=uncultured Desulfobacteraceae bacterium TaxID=218296 RepID=A0A484HGU2_9BACT|nr:Two-component sensor histidine kinase [uncultured Desulfobacteraceae bacterium]
MLKKKSGEKSKPFRLVKYFTLFSLAGIFLGASILAVLNIHWARKMQLEKSEDYALLLVENLNHQVFQQFVVPVLFKFGAIKLRNPDQFTRMDNVVRNTLHSFNVEMVNIYNMSSYISYSFDKSRVGGKNVEAAGYKKALGGVATTKLVQRGNLFEILLGIPKESKMITFAPLQAEKALRRVSGGIMGVFEIVQDVSGDYQAIAKFQILVIITSGVVMGLLFLTLLYVVKRGEKIIQIRAEERMALKERLARAEHLSYIGEMTAVISHEIRNPLGIITSSAALLKKKIAQTGVSDVLPKIIVEESARLNHIITDFLDFAKPKIPQMAQCRIQDILEKNIAFLSPQLREQGHRVSMESQTDAGEIMADSAMLYQAFLNLFINAMQSMPGGGEIRVELEKGPDFVRVKITDSGQAPPDDLMEKIWSPFFTTKEKGTGLGLGIVKNIIEAHNGKAWFQKNPGKSSTVAVELPIRQDT